MLKQQDDSSDREFRSKSSNETGVDRGRVNVTKTTGNSLEDLDRIGSSGILSVAGVQPRRDGEDDEDEGVPQNGDEEEDTS